MTSGRRAICSILAAGALALTACAGAPATEEPFDVVIRGGSVYDGTGASPREADVGIRGDRIVAIGKVPATGAKRVIEARGLAVAPGFINMLSWSTESLIADGRSQGEVRQGVTLEVMGEGASMGPLNDQMKRRMRQSQTDVKYEVEWTTLAEYLGWLEKRGISTNVASLVGAATVRTHVLGLEDVQPTPAQLEAMRELVRLEMRAGAMGVGTALIYAPGTYARTEELIELCKVAASYGGLYTSHIRSEGSKLVEAVDELIRINRESGIRAEIHHLKASGKGNWRRMDEAIAHVERARAEGLQVTANMYLYVASSTGLSARIPSWAHSGGAEALYDRLKDPATRARIAAEMRAEGTSSPALLARFRTQELKPLQGKMLEEVARSRGKDVVDTTLDLILEDRSRISSVFFTMSEENLVKQLKRPWVAISSDGASMAPEGAFLDSSTHPRAYGNFARLLGKYVREEKVITLADAIHRMTGLPASNLRIDRRGLLKEGNFADVVVFDPATVADRATFDNPHQYAIGMKHVLVNGTAVIADGEHTGAKPGRAVWGPGKGRP
ncbi:MAG: D-aminoacylase [Usitatibacter sp.]